MKRGIARESWLSLVIDVLLDEIITALRINRPSLLEAGIFDVDNFI